MRFNDEEQIPVKIFGRFWTAIDKDLKKRINLTEINGVLPLQLDGVFYEYPISETKQSEEAGKKGLRLSLLFNVEERTTKK